MSDVLRQFIELLGLITQIGVLAGGYALAKKVDRRQVEHERTDLNFQQEIRQHLGMTPPAGTH